MSRVRELAAAMRPSADPHRLLEPFRRIAVMQVMVFVFLVMAAMGVIRFALYLILVIIYFPQEELVRAVRNVFGRIEDRMNDPDVH